MNAGPNCIAVIQHYERCVLKAYPDPKTGGAPWTIGWGATGAGIGPGIAWTQAQADARLEADVAERVGDANAAIKVPMTQGQFDAFVDILFNTGHGSPIRDGIVRLKSGYPSTLLKKLNDGDKEGACEQFAFWVSPGSSVEKGLRRRRATDQALWRGMSAADAIRIGVSQWP